jgi:hypothetical protein
VTDTQPASADRKDATASEEFVYFVRPGNTSAHAALQAHQRNSIRALRSAVLFFACMGGVWLLLTTGAEQWAGTVLYGLASGVVIGLAVQETRLLRAYHRHVFAGDIVIVDRYLINVWDQLREEERIPLLDWVRDNEIPLLFDAAKDVRADLRVRATCLTDPRTADRLLMAEARIRARLLREVTALRIRREHQRELNRLAAAATDWATTAEVAKQLDVLRQRRDATELPDPESQGAQ